MVKILYLEEKFTDEEMARREGDLFNSDHYDIILDEDINDIENQFPDSEVKTISNAGHWVHAESPDDFVDMVLAFCLR